MNTLPQILFVSLPLRASEARLTHEGTSINKAVKTSKVALAGPEQVKVHLRMILLRKCKNYELESRSNEITFAAAIRAIDNKCPLALDTLIFMIGCDCIKYVYITSRSTSSTRFTVLPSSYLA